jgi:hypothetical protein
MLLFSSEKVGEFAYELELVANELPPTQLPLMTAAVGKYDVILYLQLLYLCYSIMYDIDYSCESGEPV